MFRPNPNVEIRNPKQIQMTLMKYAAHFTGQAKVQNPKQYARKYGTF
jgi:hypothetical protein